MIKIFLTILAVYLLYYAGNIVYDLFLKKDSSQQKEESEEYALTTLIGNNTPIQEVTIDDVEHLKTPSSFSTKEPFSSVHEESGEPYDLEDWRRKFESEQDIDAFATDPQIDEQSKEQIEVPEDDWAAQESIQNDEKGTFSDPKSDVEDHINTTQENESSSLKLKQQFHQFLSLAETHVQVLADSDGFKVYHSLL
ncbi:hypothetical protein [Chryseobacterium cheonjiense]|uniref:Uncharacterized protein n=1 Tax=Chryseobacterium cheonjiense TaxID=2728845 RepID=A0A7Y0A572_9FLAO|nr:hypothetical protein [Chryseobacterium cheonjiense]NML56795.1 hypothetical protein [Chryseobacterium cheonjiense]